MRSLICIIFFILCAQNVLALKQTDGLNFENCLLWQNNIFVQSSAFMKAQYLPNVFLSYRYQPKQMYPSLTSGWSSEIFPTDLLKENNGSGPATQNFSNGERHGFWAGFRWDFGDFLIDNQNQYTWHMFERRTQKRFYQMRQAYLTHNTSAPNEDFAEKIETISNQEKLKAKLAYYCEQD